jgi:hypothetical protein
MIENTIICGIDRVGDSNIFHALRKANDDGWRGVSISQTGGDRGALIMYTVLMEREVKL